MIISLLINLLLPLFICTVKAGGTSNTWPQIPKTEQNAIRSQRDIMANITIDQVPLIGVDLRQILFNNESMLIENNTGSATAMNGTNLLLNFASLLNVGVQNFVIDLEFKDEMWMVVDTPLNFNSVLATLQTFLHQSHNNLSANLLVILLRIASGTSQMLESNMALNSENNLTSILDQIIGGSYIYSPVDLYKDNNLNYTTGDGANMLTNSTSQFSWPALGNFLFQKKKRLIIAEITDQLTEKYSTFVFKKSVMHYDADNTTLACPNDIASLQNITSVSWRFLQSSFTTDDIKEYVYCGQSPIIANKFDIATVTNITDLIQATLIWTWKHNEPRLSNSRLLMGKDSMQAYNCASMTYSLSDDVIEWEVANCFNTKEGLCRKDGSEYEWLVTSDKGSYFDFEDIKDPVCPEGYMFSLPKTPLEERSLGFYLSQRSFGGAAVWIQLNSIEVSNCWITGGSYASCPYEKVVSKRSFVGMLVPVVACSSVLLVCAIYLSLVSVPIHDNRKNWRRVVNKISKSEVEGVPS